MTTTVSAPLSVTGIDFNDVRYAGFQTERQHLVLSWETILCLWANFIYEISFKVKDYIITSWTVLLVLAYLQLCSWNHWR
jgi:hypothetical protein